jgi:4-alpha-glucanotransferase
LAVAPLQDVLGYGSEARMNKPSHPHGNWRWRFQPGVLTETVARRLALLAEVTDRQPPPCTVPSDEPFSA